MSDDLSQVREKLNDQIDGGGCAEAWGAADTLRSDADQERHATRRSIMKRVAAGSALSVGAVFGLSNTAEASDVQKRRWNAERWAGRIDDARSMFASQGSELLHALAARGFLNEPVAAELSIDRFEPMSALTDQSDTNYFTAEPFRSPDGTVRPEYVTPISGASFSARVRLRPHEARAYAVVKNANGRLSIIDPSRDGSIVTDQSTYDYTYCSVECNRDCGWFFCDIDYWLIFVCRDGDTYYTCGRDCGDNAKCQ